MSDQFEGTALLSSYDGTEYLHVVAFYARENRRRRVVIPVRPAATPSARQTWEYKIEGDMLHVHPSVKITNHQDVEEFHSPGQWSVRFERFTPSPEIIWNDGIGDHGERKRMVELNPGDISI